MSYVFPNDTDEKALNIIKEYRASLDDPLHKWPVEWFDDMSYSRWATNEIIKYAQDHLNDQTYTVLKSVHEIHQLFLEYSCIGDDCNPSEPMYIFQIAERTADCILDILYAY